MSTCKCGKPMDNIVDGVEMCNTCAVVNLGLKIQVALNDVRRLKRENEQLRRDMEDARRSKVGNEQTRLLVGRLEAMSVMDFLQMVLDVENHSHSIRGSADDQGDY